MKRVWRPNKTLSIRDISSNLFLAEFEDIRDKERVKREGPWAFDKQLVLTKEVDGLEQIENISFSEAYFWKAYTDKKFEKIQDEGLCIKYSTHFKR